MRYNRTRYVELRARGQISEAARAPFAPHALAVLSSFNQQWKQMFLPTSFFTPLLSAAGPAIVLGYVAGENPTAATYVLLGTVLSTLWTMGVFRTGWSLSNEHNWGTLDLLLTTRTPIALIMLGKALAISAFVGISGVLAFVIVLAVASRTPPVDDALLLAVSVVTALASVVALCFVFAPFAFIAGIRGGFFNALMPFGTVVSGFLYPVELLPASLEAPARLLPTAWAMQAVVDSSAGGTTSDAILLQLAVAWGLIVLVFALTCWLFVEAERRVRLSGNLGSV